MAAQQQGCDEDNIKGGALSQAALCARMLDGAQRDGWGWMAFAAKQRTEMHTLPLHTCTQRRSILKPLRQCGNADRANGLDVIQGVINSNA